MHFLPVAGNARMALRSGAFKHYLVHKVQPRQLQSTWKLAQPITSITICKMSTKGNPRLCTVQLAPYRLPLPLPSSLPRQPMKTIHQEHTRTK
eukprot:1160920-Pelagomonas_calceolata.AAC.10